MNPDLIAWIAADWGTSNLRCWALAGDHHVLDQAQSSMGMQAISEGETDFETALLDLITPWFRDDRVIPVHACGMVGARQGWIEVPYVDAPCCPRTPTQHAPTRDPRLEVHIHAGVAQPHPADVMRGEETQIAGLLRLHPDFEGLVCLPGTHTKWVTIEAGRIQHFRTFMTGETFALLSEHSVLRHTLATEGHDETAFLNAVRHAQEDPVALLSHTFQLRAEALLHHLDSTTARARLSGLLIGQELAALQSTLKSDHSIALVGPQQLTSLYQAALRGLGHVTTIHDPTQTTLRGLTPISFR